MEEACWIMVRTSMSWCGDNRFTFWLRRARATSSSSGLITVAGAALAAGAALCVVRVRAAGCKCDRTHSRTHDTHDTHTQGGGAYATGREGFFLAPVRDAPEDEDEEEDDEEEVVEVEVDAAGSFWAAGGPAAAAGCCGAAATAEA
jgi:hypothetical protein